MNQTGSSSANEKAPPATFRLTDEATAALWRSYLTAKTRDPFLSLRKHLSHVVLIGVSNEESA